MEESFNVIREYYRNRFDKLFSKLNINAALTIARSSCLTNELELESSIYVGSDNQFKQNTAKYFNQNYTDSIQKFSFSKLISENNTDVFFEFKKTNKNSKILIRKNRYDSSLAFKVEINNINYQLINGLINELKRRGLNQYDNRDLQSCKASIESTLSNAAKKVLDPEEIKHIYFIPIVIPSAKNKIGGIISVNSQVRINEQDITYIIKPYIRGVISPYHLDEINLLLEKNYIKTAIISILVDSYAHNISAHSLAALKWWFQIRSNNIYDEKIDISGLKKRIKGIKNFFNKSELKKTARTKTEKISKNIGIKKKDLKKLKNFTSLLELIQFLPTIEVEKRFSYQATYEENKNFYIPVPIDYAIHHFIRFLRDKAAFWSGVTRDVNFGGESKNLYDVLWNDFAANSLYLGTIAHSEGVNKVNIHIKTPQFRNHIEFAKIDLSLIQREEKIAKGISPEENGEKIQSQYRFLMYGAKHKKIRNELRKEKYDTYFPGGVVGVHSFFTIIENTLRNIKHYKSSADWKNINEKGMDLVISINPVRLMGAKKKNKKEELFEIEVFLDHETDLLKDKKRVVEILRMRSSESILNESDSPKLGGTFQDKICAAMLLNGTFSSVNKTYCDDEFIKERNNYYFNSDRAGRFLNNKCRSWVGFKENKKNTSSKSGILKKYFYLWKSELNFKITDKNDITNENINRFKFLQTSNQEIIKIARERGIVRIVGQNEDNEFYFDWLNNWISDERILIKFQIVPKDNCGLGSPNTIGCIFKDLHEIVHLNKQEFRKKNKYFRNNRNNIKEHCIKFLHDGDHPETIHIRNHGTFLEKIYTCDFNDMGTEKIEDKNKVFDLTETILTKIVVFDDRLFDRFESKKGEKRETIKNQLNIESFKEDQKEWECFKNDFLNGINHVNFLILHLSFIEKIKKHQSQATYKEEQISEFIKSELKLNEKKAPQNFILVITTGRGRLAFWENLENHQKLFVTFKPIESLLSALEDGLIFNDDFQIKYNICKVLFGS